MIRVIGVIGLFSNGQVIQTVCFKNKNIVHSSAVHAVRKFVDSGCDEILMIDMTEAGLPTEESIRIVRDVFKSCFIPVIFGGHIQSQEFVDELFLSGVDRILCSSSLFPGLGLARYVIERYGAQAFVAGIDLERFSIDATVTNRSSQILPTSLKTWLKALAAGGITEVLLNSPLSDGSRQGYAIVDETADLIRYSSNLGMSTLMAGGAWETSHFVDAALLGVAGVAAANCFHYKEAFPLIVKKELCRHGVSVRL